MNRAILMVGVGFATFTVVGVAHAQTGACCEANGVCSQTSATICSLAKAAYSGDGTSCNDVNCFGACCFPAAPCEIKTEIVCSNEGGDFAGGDTVCEDGPCPGPVGSSFSYQGQLKLSSVPVTGLVDMQFNLWDAKTSVFQVGDTIIFDGQPENRPPVDVVNGLFQVDLDFGVDAFDGDTRWLEVAVQSPAGSGSGFETLSPRQRLAPVPYSSQTRGLFVSEAGDIGIGTTTPTAPLHIATEGSGSSTGLRFTHDDKDVVTIDQYGLQLGDSDIKLSMSTSVAADPYATFSVSSPGGGAAKLRLYRFKVVFPSSGDVGVGVCNPAYLLHVGGQAGKPGGGSWSSASDLRLKRDVAPLEGTLDRLLSLRGVSFQYIDPESIHELSGQRIGLIAQEVEEVFPDWVDQKKDGMKYVTFRGFEALTVEAFRDMRGEYKSAVEAQDTEIQALRDELESLRSMVKSLRVP